MAYSNLGGHTFAGATATAKFTVTYPLTGLTVERRANVALEYDWFGVIQSALDMACSRPNVLFDRLTSAPDAGRASTADVAVSAALAGPLAAVSLPPLVLGWVLGDGATLTLTCRRGPA